MKKLSDTQRIILSQASQHDDRLIIPPERLPAAARQTVAKSLIKQGLLSDDEASAYTTRGTWQIDGQTKLLRITEHGLHAIGVACAEPTAVDEVELGGLTAAEYEEEEALAQTALDAGDDLSADFAAGHHAAAGHPLPRPATALIPGTGLGDSHAARPSAPPSASGEAAEDAQRPPVSQQKSVARAAALRMAAATILAAWDNPARDGLDDAVAALRDMLAATPRPAGAFGPLRSTNVPRQPRTGTKQGTVLALLRREEGATIAQVIDATGWQHHTVRGFLAGLKRRGITVEVLERIRQVGPNKQGAKGSYSIYRIDAAAPVEAR